MKLTLPDVVAGAGFVALEAGLGIAVGPGWTLIVGGTLLLSIGLFAAWRRSR